MGDATRALIGLDEFEVTGAVETLGGGLDEFEVTGAVETLGGGLEVSVLVARPDAACVRCGTFSSRVKEYRTCRGREGLSYERPTTLVVSKRWFRCDTPGCVATFTESTGEVVPRRLRIDETTFGRHRSFMTGLVDLDTSRLWDLIEGRSKKVLVARLEALGEGARTLEAAVIDPYAGSTAAVSHLAPHTTRVADRFGIERLAVQALTEVRCRANKRPGATAAAMATHCGPCAGTGCAHGDISPPPPRRGVQSGPLGRSRVRLDTQRDAPRRRRQHRSARRRGGPSRLAHLGERLGHRRDEPPRAHPALPGTRAVGLLRQPAHQRARRRHKQAHQSRQTPRIRLHQPPELPLARPVPLRMTH